jgi:parvulin-like peptidyl-prolyl isomerase
MRSRLLGLCLALTFGAMGVLPRFTSAAPASLPAKDVAALVNGRAITYEVLNTAFHNQAGVPFETVQDDPQAQQARKQILEQIINEELLAEEARRQELPVTPEALNTRIKEIQARFPSEEAFNQTLRSRGLTLDEFKADMEEGLMIQQLIQKEVFAKVSVSRQELESFFQKHRDDYMEGSVHVRHILITVAPDASPEDDAKARDRAKTVLAKARKGDDFAQLAQQYSEDPSKDKGGDLGDLARGQTVKPFEDVAFSLKPGEISDLVRTTFGYHIIKVEEIKTAKRPSFEEAEDRVREDLMQEKATAQYLKYVKALQKKAKITVNLK